MNFELTNIGMIDSANIQLNGLTIIAGENDTGKSTIGKALFCILKADLMFWTNKQTTANPSNNLENLFRLVFDGQISDNGFMKIDDNYKINFQDNKSVIEKWPERSFSRKYIEATVIETPLIWSLYNFFQLVSNEIIDKSMFGQFKAEGPIYPYLLWDVYMKLSHPKSYKSIHMKQEIITKIIEIIGGSFHKHDNNKYSFVKDNSSISLLNVATGIKHFGILQILLENNYVQENKIFFFDEPEVHLHPKWQLKYAEILVELVKAGISVVVSSHSPYMIEALKVYSEKNKISQQTNFYLAQKDTTSQKSSIQNVNQKLELIFEKLSAPFDDIEKLELDNIQW